MWCPQCKQEVAITGPAVESPTCPVCEAAIRPGSKGEQSKATAMAGHPSTTVAAAEAASTIEGLPPALHANIAASLTRSQRLLSSVALRTKTASTSASLPKDETSARRVDNINPQSGESPPAAAPAVQPPPPPPVAAPPTHPWHGTTGRAAPRAQSTFAAEKETGAPLAWSLLLFGLSGVSCGGILLAWAWWAHRPELWTYGLPIALIGQGLLLLGLVGQIDYLGRRHRSTTASLTALDQHLGSLEQAGAVGPLPTAISVHYGHHGERG